MAALIREPPRDTGRRTESACARRPTRSTSRRSRAHRGRRRAPPGRRLLERGSIEEIVEFLRREFAAATARKCPRALAERHRPARQARRALVVRVRPRPGSRTGARTGHAGTLDPFATGLMLSCPVGQLSWRHASWDSTSVTSRTSTSGATATGRPGGGDRRAARATVGGRAGGALEGLRGEIELPIPAASAVKSAASGRTGSRAAASRSRCRCGRSRVDTLDVIA